MQKLLFFFLVFLLISCQNNYIYTEEDIRIALSHHFSNRYSSTFSINDLKCYQIDGGHNCYFEIQEKMSTYIFADTIQIVDSKSFENYITSKESNYKKFSDMTAHSEIISPMINDALNTPFIVFSYLLGEQKKDSNNHIYKYDKNIILIAFDDPAILNSDNYQEKAEQIINTIPLMSPTTEIVFLRYDSIDELTNLHLCSSYFNGFMGLSIDSKYSIKKSSKIWKFTASQ